MTFPVALGWPALRALIEAETEPVQAPDDTPAEPADDVVDEPPKPTEPEEKP